ncbi:MAG: maleylpyruvate isomerase family mycothiol-dependent enzyme [Acidimicrobiia bacterium]
MTLLALENLRRCYASVDELLGELGDQEWQVASLCPAWDVRGVVGHLGAVEHMLLGEAPGSMTESIPFAKAGEWLASVHGLSDADFLDRYRAVIEARLAELATLTDDQLERPSLTPVGPGTYGRFMAIRVFDYWVHEQDMRVPLGRPGHESGPAAEMAIDEIHRSLPYIVGKKIGLPDGMSITFELTGPVEREMHLRVDGRAGLVDDLDSPADVTLVADSTTFALLACGRINPQGPVDDGRVTWSGADDWGERTARNLAFTM